jgi:stress-induced morphogen
MAMQAHEIEALIRETFPDAQITITDLAGDGNHYAAEVIDESFRGKTVFNNNVRSMLHLKERWTDHMASFTRLP